MLSEIIEGTLILIGGLIITSLISNIRIISDTFLLQEPYFMFSLASNEGLRLINTANTII